MTAELTVDETLALEPAAVDLLFRQARTTSKFTDEPVTEEQRRAIMELVKMGPTAFNNQPLRVTFVQSDEARERLVAHLAGGNQEKTRKAPLTAILSYDSEWHEHFPTFNPVAPQMKSMFDDDAENRHKMGNNNANLQAGYFIMAVRSVGLAAGPMSGYDAAGVDEEFFAGSNTHSFMLVNIGRAAEGAWGERLPRFDYDDVVTTL
ncbi:malonic semialdehyde reductase [Arthrobacter castelli]|uniref:malonic semialdehyde reductase n=1 Tax=Arthrobacter castelli TaxID=271431 RepID=UPI0003FB865A|nr:malonic semialdehyde reductase [Arthrobacter castelli]